MAGSARDFGSYGKVLELVRAGVLGVTNAGTTAIDMRTCRNGRLLISQTIGTDVATDFTLEHSYDNSTWATLVEVTDANLAASTLYQVDVANTYRYLRITWTRAAANADTYWAVLYMGTEPVTAPVP